MTETFQKYGVHAEVRPDGELFLNAGAVTLSATAASEFFLWVAVEYHSLAELDEQLPVFDETPPSTEEQAEADDMNNDDYNEGTAQLLETPLEDLFDDVKLTPPPVKGPGSGADKWREFAALVTDTDVAAWANFKASDIQAALREQGVLS